jgi:hypothetical protein
VRRKCQSIGHHSWPEVRSPRKYPLAGVAAGSGWRGGSAWGRGWRWRDCCLGNRAWQKPLPCCHFAAGVDLEFFDERRGLEGGAFAP